ncbi:hypothetical protein KR018_000374 [Drosophila ironensis]|nr:hypothetical protein KR018_000374 [Drosophila ironensis]
MKLMPAHPENKSDRAQKSPIPCVEDPTDSLIPFPSRKVNSGSKKSRIPVPVRYTATLSAQPVAKDVKAEGTTSPSKSCDLEASKDHLLVPLVRDTSPTFPKVQKPSRIPVSLITQKYLSMKKGKTEQKQPQTPSMQAQQNVQEQAGLKQQSNPPKQQPDQNRQSGEQQKHIGELTGKAQNCQKQNIQLPNDRKENYQSNQWCNMMQDTISNVEARPQGNPPHEPQQNKMENPSFKPPTLPPTPPPPVDQNADAYPPPEPPQGPVEPFNLYPVSPKEGGDNELKLTLSKFVAGRTEKITEPVIELLRYQCSDNCMINVPSALMYRWSNQMLLRPPQEELIQLKDITSDTMQMVVDWMSRRCEKIPDTIISEVDAIREIIRKSRKARGLECRNNEDEDDNKIADGGAVSNHKCDNVNGSSKSAMNDPDKNEISNEEGIGIDANRSGTNEVENLSTNRKEPLIGRKRRASDLKALECEGRLLGEELCDLVQLILAAHHLGIGTLGRYASHYLNDLMDQRSRSELSLLISISDCLSDLRESLVKNRPLVDELVNKAKDSQPDYAQPLAINTHTLPAIFTTVEIPIEEQFPVTAEVQPRRSFTSFFGWRSASVTDHDNMAPFSPRNASGKSGNHHQYID